MKKKYGFSAVLVCAVMLAFAAAKDLDGKWSGELINPDFNATLTYTFKINGEKLTGKVDGPDGSVPIDSGVFTNNTFKFVITTSQGYRLPTTGKYYGDSTTVDFPINGQTQHIRLLRVQ